MGLAGRHSSQTFRSIALTHPGGPGLTCAILKGHLLPPKPVFLHHPSSLSLPTTSLTLPVILALDFDFNLVRFLSLG